MLVEDTRQSLLVRAQQGDEAAWGRFADLYRPLIVGWLRRHALEHHDVEDLAQEVLLAVVKHLPEFSHTGRRGAFRAWLRTITINRTRDFWKARSGQPAAAGGSGVLDMVQQLEDPESELSRLWDEQHDQYVLRCLLDLMELEFEPTTVQAFQRVALDGAAAEEVGRELGLSVGAVYVAKSRVLKRIREEAEGLID
jgi:RNA polymerase sigma-70 factor (ECF subfamily)